MGPAQSISTALASLKIAGDMAASLIGVRDATQMQGKVFDLQREILSAQQSAINAHSGQSELNERVKKLEKELSDMDDWEDVQNRYQLTNFGSETFAYVLKVGCENGEPTHKVCPSCFQKRLISILQFQDQKYNRQDSFLCPSCKNEFNLGTPQIANESCVVVKSGDWMSA